jgi:hypothetical protein
MFRKVLVASLLLLGVSGVALGRYVQWKPKDVPPVSLQQALALADKELEKHKGKYHCVGATLAKSFTGADWELRYSSPEGKPLWISIGAEKSVRVSEEGFAYK